MEKDDLSVYDEEDDISIFDTGSSTDGSAAGSLHVAREDIQLMNVVRAIVILMLLTFAFIASDSVLVIATISEQNEFREAYDVAASELIAGFYEDVTDKLWATRGLTTGITSAARSSFWPNVSLPDFEDHCVTPLKLAEASTITFSPLVQARDRSDWQNYAAEAYPFIHVIGPDHTINGSQDASGVFYYPTERSVGEGIYYFEGTTALTEPTSSNPLFPIWQMAPRVGNKSEEGLSTGIMFDQQSTRVRAQALDGMLLRQGAIMSTFLYQDTNGTDFAFYKDPRSMIAYPIFETLSPQSAVVGSVNTEFKWEPVLGGTLTDYSDPLVVVVENECGGSFSYEVAGLNATYLGEGDFQDPSVDGYTPVNSSYDDFAALFDEHGATTINGETACNYRITIYPTKAFKSTYTTTTPAVYRGIVLLIFLVMVGVRVYVSCIRIRLHFPASSSLTLLLHLCHRSGVRGI